MQTDEIDEAWHQIMTEKNRSSQAVNTDSTQEVPHHKSSHLDVIINDIENKLTQSVDTLVKEHLKHSGTKLSETDDSHEGNERNVEPENKNSQDKHESKDLHTTTSECKLKDIIDNAIARAFQMIFSSDLMEGSSSVISGSSHDRTSHQSDWSNVATIDSYVTHKINMVSKSTSEEFIYADTEHLVRKHLDESVTSLKDHYEPEMDDVHGENKQKSDREAGQQK